MYVIAAKYFTNTVVIEFHKCIENMYLGIFRLLHINWGGLWVYILSFICLYMTKYYIKPEGYFSLHRKFKMLGKTTIFIPYQHFPTVIKYFKIKTGSCQFFFCPILLIKWPAFLRFICFMQVLMTSIFQSLRFVYAFESVSYTIFWRLILFNSVNNSHLIDKYFLYYWSIN